MISYIKSIRKKDDRSTIALLNVIMSFIIKGISILVSLVLVPLTLHFLDTYEYGLWLTISSILLWIDYFDIGLGNGLRNKLSEALVAKDMELAKEYVRLCGSYLVDSVKNVPSNCNVPYTSSVEI